MKTLFAMASLALLAGCASQEAVDDGVASVTVPALRETQPMSGGEGDAADDPALWVHPTDASLSLILGTNKDEGLYVYDLAGTELDKLLIGQLNNVDLRDNLAVASNDERNVLSWFAIDPATRKVTHLADTPTNKIVPYGVCAGKVDGVYKAAATYKDGSIQFWSLGSTTGIAPVLEREAKVATQVEGCVFDDANKRFFVGEEDRGVWSLDLADPQSKPVLVDEIAGKHGLVADIEGVSLWLGADGGGYLVVSAQGLDRYVVYDRKPPHAPRGVIKIGPSADGQVDGTSTTDGLEASSTPLPGLPRGVLIVQDDANPVSRVNQNFKIVDWREIENALGLPR